MIVNPQCCHSASTTMKHQKNEQALIYKHEFWLPEAMDWFQFIAKLGSRVWPCTILVATCKAVGYQGPCADVWKYVPVQAMVLSLHPIGVWNCMKVSKMDRIVGGSGIEPKNEEEKRRNPCDRRFSLGAIFDAFFDHRKVPKCWSFFWCHEKWFQNPLRTNFQSSKIKSGIPRPPPGEMIVDHLQGVYNLT